jgi:hypothetical protein
VFYPVHQGGYITRERMAEQAIYDMVADYAYQLNLGGITPHESTQDIR